MPTNLGSRALEMQPAPRYLNPALVTEPHKTCSAEYSQTVVHFNIHTNFSDPPQKLTFKHCVNLKQWFSTGSRWPIHLSTESSINLWKNVHWPMCNTVSTSYSWAVAYAENFHGRFGSRSYGGYLYLVCTVCDVTIWRHFHVSKPTFWRSLLT